MLFDVKDEDSEMKKLLIAIMSVIMAFSLAACGGGGGDEGDTSGVQTLEGKWECTGVTMKDGDSEFGTEEIEKLYGLKVKDMAALTAYGDGTGELKLFEDAAEITWTEGDKGYEISMGEEDTLTAALDGETLNMTIDSDYEADGETRTMQFELTFKYAGPATGFFDDWDLEMSEEQVRDMSNAMAFGHFVYADGYLYGGFGGDQKGSSETNMAEVKAGEEIEVGEVKRISDKEWGTYLTECDGYVYAILSESDTKSRMVKIKVGETKCETIYDKNPGTLQIVGDKIYFSDEDANLCTMDLEGKNVEKVIDKAVYYPYVLPNDVVIYQDDADGETLHLYKLNNGKDVKINESVSHQPIVCGDYVYYMTPVSEGSDSRYLERCNLLSGKVETASETEIDYDYYFIENNEIIFGFSGLVTISVDEWDQLHTKNYAGFKIAPEYSDGELRVMVEPSGAVHVTTKTFEKRNNLKDLGYTY